MDRKILLLILVVASIGPAKLALLYAFPPQGMVFNGYSTDDAIIFGSIMSIGHGFQSAWSMPADAGRHEIFFNPANGPVYIAAAIGMIYALTSIDAFILFALAKIAFGVIFLFAAYRLIELLSGQDKNKIFVLFCLSAGLGGILYMFFRLLTDPSAILEPFSLFAFGAGPFRILDFYYSIPFTFALLAVIKSIERKHILSGIFMGMTVLFYPLYGIMTFISIAVYWLAFRRSTLIDSVAKPLAVTIPFAIPWAASYLLNKGLYSYYADVNRSLAVVFLPSLFLGIGLAAFFSAYYVYKHVRWTGKKFNYAFIAVVSIAAIIISLSQLQQTIWTRLDPAFTGAAGSLGILGDYYPVFELPFLALLALIFIRAMKIPSKETRFSIMWLVSTAFILMIPTGIAPISIKLISFVVLPAVITGFLGMKELAQRWGISITKIIMIAVILSLPSIILLQAFEMQNIYRSIENDSPLNPRDYYYTHNDIEALQFMKSLPYGTAISSPRIGSYIPSIADKKSLMISGRRKDVIMNYDDKEADMISFYNSTADEAMRIIEKYDITYVFYGDFEKEAGFKSPSRFSFLEKIYSKGAEVYRILE